MSESKGGGNFVRFTVTRAAPGVWWAGQHKSDPTGHDAKDPR